MSYQNKTVRNKHYNYYLFFIASFILATINCCKQETKNEDWPSYGGNKKGNRYSNLNQINTHNVKNLKVVWTYTTGENIGTEKGLEIQCQPIIVKGILYGTTPQLKVFALHADNGKQIWKFDPYEKDEPQFHVNRGVAYWEQGDDKRILFSAGSKLYALNAMTGKPIKDFGTNGFVDLHTGLAANLNRDITQLSVVATSPGVVYKDILVIGSRVSELGDAAPGDIRGFDIKSGKLIWSFHTIPHPGEAGYDTWPANAWKNVGGANAWSGIVLDEKRGVVYTGTGSASFDFYGANRSGANLFANCILALNATTGKRIWHFQTVHHDVWDRDLPCPPNLVTVIHNGKKIDAVAQTTKDGLIYVLDRDSGKPLFPVEEKPVIDTGAMPGEELFPTQPYPLKPAPFARQVFTKDEITDLSPEAHAFVLKRLENTTNETKYSPPSTKGILILGIGGGAEWGGNAADLNGILYQNSNEMVWDLKLVDVATRNKEITSKGKMLYNKNCVACHGADRKGSGMEYPSLVNINKRLSEKEINAVLKTGRGRMPSFNHLIESERKAIIQFLSDKGKEIAQIDPHVMKDEPTITNADFPYLPPYVNNGWQRFFDPNGYPAIKPPWGTLNAIDLNTGEYIWKVPLGEFPELTKKGIPQTGTENYGGPIVTQGGLLFIGATKDEKFRAFDTKTGKVLWEFQLPAGAFATPATYKVNGKQYVVIAAGGSKNGHKPGDSYIAFALP